MFFTDIDREAGEATRKQFLSEFGEARAEFSVQDVTDSAKWRQVWTQAETFFGGQVRIQELLEAHYDPYFLLSGGHLGKQCGHL